MTDHTDLPAPVTEELVAKLRQRDAAGWEKYGQPLHPFDGRNTEIDIEEELLDALQYVTKMRMEREEIADLLQRAAFIIDPVNDRYRTLIAELFARAASLRADVWRIGGAK